MTNLEMDRIQFDFAKPADEGSAEDQPNIGGIRAAGKTQTQKDSSHWSQKNKGANFGK